MRTTYFHLLLLIALSFSVAACNFNGGVEQGRCVAFDAAAKTLTIVEDTSLDQHNPHYSGKVFTFKLPEDPQDMGPEPFPGGLLQVEPEKNMVLVYDPASQSIHELPVQIKLEKNVMPSDKRVKGQTFPIINREEHTITVYSPRLEAIVVLKVSDADLDLPKYTWELGEEVRVAYRNDQKGQAIRVMNVSKTSIFTR